VWGWFFMEVEIKGGVGLRWVRGISSVRLPTE